MQKGLSNREATTRLDEVGPNEISAGTRRSVLVAVWEIMTEPMLLLLLVAALVYLLIGDLAEGLLLVGFAVFTTFLVILQQTRSDKALESLRALGAPSARVIRDGVEVAIPSREMVPGDIAIIEAGERIPADGRLLNVEALVVDESLLTGESVPVTKVAAAEQHALISKTQPGGDDQPFVFSGTLAVRGRGIAEIIDTGPRTRAGEIGVSLASIVTEKTRLQQSTAQIVRIFGLFAFMVSGFIIAYYGIVRAEWLQGTLSGIAVAMAMLPEEFPVALTVFLAIGAWRLAQIQVLARRPAVVEMLGAATVLCVDKTGTLTENRMHINALDTGEQSLKISDIDVPLPAAFHDLVEAAYLATGRATLDPMDSAVASLAIDAFEEADRLHADWPLEREYGLAPELMAMSQAWRRDDGKLAVATKGAPEAVAELCHLDAQTRAELMTRVHKMAEQGLRVLAVAAGTSAAKELPDNQHDFDFTLLGLIGFHDPVRATVPATVAIAARAGMHVKMITGDFPETARVIAQAAGIDCSAGVLTGDEIVRMDEIDLRRAVTRINVYARMMPEQKLRLVEALKANGEVVAMTGDGVNDAPALKAAHIGIAMGAGGTDVAREASGIILLDEDFGRIVSAVAMGRRIFQNLRKVMIYISSVHVSIAGLALIPLIVGWPPLLFPAHVVLIEMIIDPMSSITFETTPDEPDLMDQKPRPLSEPLAGIRQIGFGLLQGSVLLVACLIVYWFSAGQGTPVEQTRTLVVLAMTAGNLGLVRVNDTRALALTKLFAKGHRAFWIIAAAASGVLTVCIMHPGLRELFAFGVPEPTHAALAIAFALALIFAFDFVKLTRPVQRILGYRPARQAVSPAR